MNDNTRQHPTGDDTADGISAEIEAFRAGFKTLVMATSDADGLPTASYTPYVDDPDGFVVFVSELAQHTGNLLERRRAAVLFIEDESASANLFARRRLGYDCEVIEIARDSADGTALLDRFEARLGGTVRVLRSLPDFHLIRLRPLGGSYVKGFGAAYQWEGMRPPAGQQPVHPRND